MNDKPNESTCCGQAPAAQRESLHSIPQSTSNHKNPEMTPVGSKAMTGGKLN